MPDTISTKILIAFHHSSQTIENTVNNILQVNVREDFEVTLVLVENGKKQKYESKFDNKLGLGPVNLEYLYNSEKGKSKALNFAIKKFDDDDFIIFTDDDITVNNNWVSMYVDTIREHPMNSFFGGGMQCNYEEEPSSDIKHLLPKSALGVADDFYSGIKSKLFLGCNWGCYSSYIKDAGYFNEELGPGTNKTGQESDMQLRLRYMDLKQIYIPENLVIHYVPSNRSDWDFIVNRLNRIIQENKVLKPNRRKRLKIEIAHCIKLILLSPKNISALNFTMKYIYLRIYRTI